MQTFKNKNFIKRDYEATNIVACIANEAPVTADNRWVPVAANFTANLTPIYTQNGVQYFGHL